MSKLVECVCCGGNGCCACQGEGEVKMATAVAMQHDDGQEAEVQSGEQPYLDKATRRMVWPEGWLQRVISEEKARIEEVGQ